MKKTEYCTDCELKIKTTFLFNEILGDQYKDGYRCYDCSDKKKGKQ